MYHLAMVAPALRAAAALAMALLSRSSIAEEPAAPGPLATARVRCTLPGADDWREYRSAHFVVATDVSRSRAAALVEELERIHALVVTALFGESVEIQGRVHVVAFASSRRFDELAGENVAGYMKLGEFGEPVIVFPFDGRMPMPEIVAHELTHQVSWHHFPRQPPWFREGLAQFIQPVAVARADARSHLGTNIVRGDPRGGGHWAGYAAPDLLDGITWSGSVRAKELLEWRGQVDDADPGKFHAASWVLYHWLWNQRSKQFSAYQERLASGADPSAAWLASFPEYDPASAEGMKRLDAELERYRRDGRYVAYRVDDGTIDPSFTDAPLPAADLHRLRLAIRSPRRWPKTADERRAFTRGQLDEALAEDPKQPWALRLRASAERTSVAEALRPAAAARPHDFRAWLHLAQALDESKDAQEKEDAFRRAIALAPDTASANNGLAWLLATSGRAREARPFAQRAFDLAPWDPNIVDTLAYVAFQIGQCRPALVLPRRAADLYPAGNPVGDRVRQRLAEYEAKCGAAEAPPAASSPVPTSTGTPAAPPPR